MDVDQDNRRKSVLSVPPDRLRFLLIAIRYNAAITELGLKQSQPSPQSLIRSRQRSRVNVPRGRLEWSKILQLLLAQPVHEVYPFCYCVVDRHKPIRPSAFDFLVRRVTLVPISQSKGASPWATPQPGDRISQVPAMPDNPDPILPGSTSTVRFARKVRLRLGRMASGERGLGQRPQADALVAARPIRGRFRRRKGIGVPPAFATWGHLPASHAARLRPCRVRGRGVAVVLRAATR